MTGPDRESDLIGSALREQRPAGVRTPLRDPSWRYVETGSMESLTAADWAMLDMQREPYMRAERPRQALEMLAAQRRCASFGYQVNNYEHCLQSATLAIEDGQDDETVVVALFHDIGYAVCGATHGVFAATLLKPYVDPKHVWTLERHMYFQARYCPDLPGADTSIAQRWRRHAYYDWADMFVRKFDVDAMRADFTNAPLEAFIPMIESVFSKTPGTFVPE